MEFFANKPKAILFDFDGVLGDTHEDNYRGWCYALGKYGVDVSRDEYFVLEGYTVQEIARILMENHNISNELHSEVWHNKEKFYRENAIPKLFPESIDLVLKLKSMGFKLGVVSGGTSKRLDDPALKQLFGYMDGRVTGDDVERSKPWPDPYLKGAEKLGVSPADCVVIENAPPGITAAKSAGMRCIAVCSSLSSKYLKEADFIIDNLGALYGLFGLEQEVSAC